MPTKHDSVFGLTKTLANLLVLSMNARNAHWNVVGPDFHAMHAFFESLYDGVDPEIDEVAERIRALGFPAPTHLPEMVAIAAVKGRPGILASSEALLTALLADYETMVAGLRHEIRASGDADDPTTTDLLTGLLAKFEKAVWMIRSHQVSNASCSVSPRETDSCESHSCCGG